jgi:hypothetical protein
VTPFHLTLPAVPSWTAGFFFRSRTDGLLTGKPAPDQRHFPAITWLADREGTLTLLPETDDPLQRDGNPAVSVSPDADLPLKTQTHAVRISTSTLQLRKARDREKELAQPGSTLISQQNMKAYIAPVLLDPDLKERAAGACARVRRRLEIA